MNSSYPPGCDGPPEVQEHWSVASAEMLQDMMCRAHLGTRDLAKAIKRSPSFVSGLLTGTILRPGISTGLAIIVALNPEPELAFRLAAIWSTPEREAIDARHDALALHYQALHEAEMIEYDPYSAEPTATSTHGTETRTAAPEES